MSEEIHVMDIREPHAIEAESFAIIDREVPFPRPCTTEQWPVLRRMIHTSADFELLDLVVFHPDAIESCVDALLSGAALVTDTQMALQGIPKRRLDPLGCSISCLMMDPDVGRVAREQGQTRARVAVDKALDEMSTDIFVIGNAPTALLRLLERLEQGARPPRLIIGMPVGFVNAAESKALLERQSPVPYILVRGRKGGSALAASAVNALAEMALARKGLQV